MKEVSYELRERKKDLVLVDNLSSIDEVRKTYKTWKDLGVDVYVVYVTKEEVTWGL